MKIKVRGETAAVVVEGFFSSDTMDEIVSAIEKIGTVNEILIDMTEVEHMTANGVGALLHDERAIFIRRVEDGPLHDLFDILGTAKRLQQFNATTAERFSAILQSA